MSDHASVRYLVTNVGDAVTFYTTHFGFDLVMDKSPGFALLSRGSLRLYLNATLGEGGGAQAMPDGRVPEPGGWNRFQLTVDDLVAEVDRLRSAGVELRNEIVVGRGGSQVLVDDPSGNPVELFQPAD